MGGEGRIRRRGHLTAHRRRKAISRGGLAGAARFRCRGKSHVVMSSKFQGPGAVSRGEMFKAVLGTVFELFFFHVSQEALLDDPHRGVPADPIRVYVYGPIDRLLAAYLHPLLVLAASGGRPNIGYPSILSPRRVRRNLRLPRLPWRAGKISGRRQDRMRGLRPPPAGRASSASSSRSSRSSPGEKRAGSSP